MKAVSFLAVAALAPAIKAQASLYQQCGGTGFSGSTTCVSGAYCSKVNDYYWQCLPGTGSSTSAPAATSAAPAPTTFKTSKTVGSPATGSSTTGSSATATASPGDGSNPLKGKNFYANSYYASEINNLAAPSLVAAGNAALAAKASNVAKVGTFYWLDVRAKVPIISTFAKDVQKRNAAGANEVLPLVVYDLPERDCAALASNGELSLANNGTALYQEYIDMIAAQIKQFPDVTFLLVVEPDSLANLVTNLNVAKCANAATAYKTLTAYAIKTLNLKNVIMYLDAGHAGWLGWTANIEPAAELFGALYKSAGSPAAVRGLVTNVANYNAWSIATCPSYTQGNTNCDEKRYVNALAPLLVKNGFPAHFLTDTGRNGVQPTKQQAWGDWCNVIGTGFGIRPSSTTDDPLLDAYVWVKPGGEGDGTSDTSAVRYDAHCGYADALKPAPEAGSWFQAYFVQLLSNASPSF
ncbi:glucanase [Parastagonospora nodorum]|nr:glucanase [Parastagonospora nodorum]KAH4066345.1 glucanase [Parastagonospora nodorum]KAH4089426.1 glucanase [Parastagonospora nodorum]KAH4813357.1 glucanase [Parastagonospora nodorum]KAH5274137.1 glucanase [Parastagonospora nodorum]